MSIQSTGVWDWVPDVHPEKKNKKQCGGGFTTQKASIVNGPLSSRYCLPTTIIVKEV